MIVSAIVATDKNRVIGKDNQIPWYLPADLKYFKKTTLNHHVIMGRKTFLSIGKPLPKRTNIVLTRNLFFAASGVITAHTLEEALSIAKENNETEAFIIGGAQIYELSLPYLDRIYLTEVDTVVADGDTYFPSINDDEWKLVDTHPYKADNKNEFNYVFKKFYRKNLF